MLNRGAASRPARPLSAGARGRSAAVAGANRAAALAAGSREAANARERALFLGSASPEAPGAPGAQAPSAAAARARRRSAAARLGSKSLAVLMAVILAVGLMPLPAFGDGGVVVNGERVVAAAASSLTTVDADGNVTTESAEATLSGDGTVTVDGRRVPALDSTAESLALYRLQRLTAGSATIADLKGYSSASGLSPAAGIAAAAQRAEDEAAAALAAEDAAVDGRIASDPELAEQLAGMDFSTQRIVVALSDGASLQERDADCVASEGSGVYVLQYGDEDSARRAYVRYLDRGGVLFAAPDSAVEAADGAAGTSGSLAGGGAGDDSNGGSGSGSGGSGSSGGPDGGSGSGGSGDGSGDGDGAGIEGPGTDAPVADLGSLDGDQQALAEDAERRESGDATAPAERRPALVALIDTAVPSDFIDRWNSEGGHSAELVGRVSAIGDAQPDLKTTDEGYEPGHGAKMLAAILEANPDARVLSIEALDGTGYGSAATVYAALALATAARADVYSMSFAGYAVAGNEAIGAGVREALKAAEDQEREVALLAAAGNQGADARFFVPASYDGVDAVGALDPAKLAAAAADEAKADPQAYRQASSNFGEAVDLWAPGDSTSFAAATAAGTLSDLFNSIASDNRMLALQSVLLAGAGSAAGRDGQDNDAPDGGQGSQADGQGGQDDADGHDNAGGHDDAGAQDDGDAAAAADEGGSGGDAADAADGGQGGGPGGDSRDGGLLGGLATAVSEGLAAGGQEGSSARPEGAESHAEENIVETFASVTRARLVEAGVLAAAPTTLSTDSQNPSKFAYSGSVVELVAPVSGLYKFELWGAQGGGGNYSGSKGTGGKGGYTVAYVQLSASEHLKLVVGGMGASNTDSYKKNTWAGYNGGGTTGAWGSSEYDTQYLGQGGGATHLAKMETTSSGAATSAEAGRTTLSTYKSATSWVVAVAGGGGGGGANATSMGSKTSRSANGGAGGYWKGGRGYNNDGTNTTQTGGYGGQQDRGGYTGPTATEGSGGRSGSQGSFGQGGNATQNNYGANGGGSGWYGGGSGNYYTSYNSSGGGGGSSHLSSHVLGVSSAQGSNNTSNQYTGTYSGQNYTSVMQQGVRQGNGYAQATLVSDYTVTFEANGGAGSMASQTAISSSAYVVPALAGTLKPPTGQRFAGWKVKYSGSTTIVQPGTSFTANSQDAYDAGWRNTSGQRVTSSNNSTVTLVAQWEKYTTYHGADGSGDAWCSPGWQGPTVALSEADALAMRKDASDGARTKAGDGKVFVGWAESPAPSSGADTRAVYKRPGEAIDASEKDLYAVYSDGLAASAATPVAQDEDDPAQTYYTDRTATGDNSGASAVCPKPACDPGPPVPLGADLGAERCNRAGGAGAGGAPRPAGRPAGPAR